MKRLNLHSHGLLLWAFSRIAAYSAVYTIHQAGVHLSGDGICLFARNTQGRLSIYNLDSLEEEDEDENSERHRCLGDRGRWCCHALLDLLKFLGLGDVVSTRKFALALTL
jgi:hypothetical protein